MKPFEPAKPGTTLAGFDVIAEVGRGAASIIYLVTDPKSKQIWALKHVIKEDAKDQRFLDQAEAEYAISQKIDSDVIRRIDRVIKARKKLIQIKELFLVMEYVDGISVERQPPKTVADAMNIFIQTARGLHAMHEAGFVHADMKPNNICITEDHSVKVIDLGQACPIGTVKERIQGTPDYIAPEQVYRREITPKTDIYNLGATMYWVLTRQHIPTAMSQKKEGSLLSGIGEHAVKPPTPAVELNPQVPLDLSMLIDECVKADSDARPDSMAEVIQELEDIQDDVLAA